MVEKPFLSTLRLSAGTAVNLRSGDLVLVQVLKRLGGGQWTVGVKGRTLRATSDLELIPGERLRARVALENGRPVLRLREGNAGQAEDILRRAGLPQDLEVRHIVNAFLRSGLGVRSEQVLQARRLLEKLQLDPRRGARLVALALEKGIDLQSPGLEELLPILDYGEQGGGRRRFRGRQMPEQDAELQPEQQIGQQLSAALSEDREQDSPLQLFNHLRGRDGSWVVVPFHFTWSSGAHLHGTLRLLYDEAKQTSRRLVLVVEKEQEPESGNAEPRRRWSFSLDPDPDSQDGYSMSIYCTDPPEGEAAREELGQLRLKLQNLGVKTDDTIRIDDGFDGFSPTEDATAYRGIDVER